LRKIDFAINAPVRYAARARIHLRHPTYAHGSEPEWAQGAANVRSPQTIWERGRWRNIDRIWPDRGRNCCWDLYGRGLAWRAFEIHLCEHSGIARGKRSCNGSSGRGKGWALGSAVVGPRDRLVQSLIAPEPMTISETSGLTEAREGPRPGAQESLLCMGGAGPRLRVRRRARDVRPLDGDDLAAQTGITAGGTTAYA
jgi:hypothetical protein